MISIAGGVYRERCVQPRWNQLFGSAGRAAAAIAPRTEVELVTYIDDLNRRELEARAGSFGNVTLRAEPVPQTVSFDYVHPLSVPVVLPTPQLIHKPEPLHVEGDVLLRFGLMEGTAIVAGERVVYDPQSAYAPEDFSANGSRAESLAIVANSYEIRLLTRQPDVLTGAREVLRREGAEVVVVKCGSQGALVVEQSGEHRVPAYRTQLVFSVGAGDVFAAAFTYFWGSEAVSPVEAATLASKSTARYCETRSAPLLTRSDLDVLALTPVAPKQGKVYLAAPFFTLPDRWLVEEARTHLLDMGLEVFSPVHDVGPGPAEVVAPADLEGLHHCDRMLALVDGADPGTLFEVGYARARDVPVVALAESLSEDQLKMLTGSGCQQTDDFATAVYLTAWLG